MDPRPDRLTVEATTRIPRRRDVGTSSARWLLLTLLGEFVLPRGEGVWTGALLEALGELRVEERAARKALSRTSAEGLIRGQRVGRKTRWELTAAGTQRLSTDAARIRDFGAAPDRWDGRWLILAVTIPETHRSTRQRLRTRLSRLGAGSPAPGLWLLPRASMEGAVAEVVDELGVGANAMSWIGSSSRIGRIEDVVHQTWSLDDIAEGYADFIAAFGRRAPRTRLGCFTAHVELVQAWRRFPILDPRLPREVLPADWPGSRAAELFHSCHRDWHERAQKHWDEISARTS